GSFEFADPTPGDSGKIKQVNIAVDVAFDYNPVSADPAQHNSLIGQYALNDPNAQGACAFSLSAPLSALADGKTSIKIDVLNVTDQANGVVEDNSAPITLTADKGQFSNGRDSTVVTTTKTTTPPIVANASALYFVGNVPGIAKIVASYNCGDMTVTRNVVVVLLDPGQTGKSSISVVSDKAGVPATGTSSAATITSFAFQPNGDPVLQMTPIVFETSFAGSTLWDGDPLHPPSNKVTVLTPDGTGKATAYLNVGYTPGITTITATYNNVPDDSPSAKTTVKIYTLGAITFVKSEPAQMGVKNSGYNESSNVQFKVFDDSGNIIPEGQEVLFDISDAPGRPYLLIDKSWTDVDGLVSTVLVSGTVATTITVTAKSTIGQTTLNGSSPPIPIVGAKPSARYFSVGTVTPFINQDEGNYKQDYQFVAHLGDRYSNMVLKPTTVHFRTEAGTITPQAISADAKAQATQRKIQPYPIEVPYCNDLDPAMPYCANTEPHYGTHNPRDGFMTMIAVTTGEEEYQDDDGNGEFNQSYVWYYLGAGVPPHEQPVGPSDMVCSWAGFDPVTKACTDGPAPIGWHSFGGSNFIPSEPFVDLPEPYVDKNDNGICDPVNPADLGKQAYACSEPYFDSNNNGLWDQGNKKWDPDTTIWDEGYQTWTREMDISWSKFGECSATDTDNNFVDDWAAGIVSRNWLCNDGINSGTVFNIPKMGAMDFRGRICDMNLNSLISERDGGIAALWTTSPGIYVCDSTSCTLKPSTVVNMATPIPLIGRTSVGITLVKSLPFRRTRLAIIAEARRFTSRTRSSHSVRAL
ncbi:MAG: hypothetical protein WC889_08200, partial [Myxococcota bacterium]